MNSLLLVKTNFAFRGAYSMSNSNHNRLIKCKSCKLKYPPENLVLFGGYYVCKPCMKEIETNTFEGDKNE